MKPLEHSLLPNMKLITLYLILKLPNLHKYRKFEFNYTIMSKDFVCMWEADKKQGTLTNLNIRPSVVRDCICSLWRRFFKA